MINYATFYYKRFFKHHQTPRKVITKGKATEIIDSTTAGVLYTK